MLGSSSGVGPGEDAAALGRQPSFSAPYRSLLRSSSGQSGVVIHRAQTERNLLLTNVGGSSSNLVSGMDHAGNTTKKLRRAFLQSKTFSSSAKALRRQDSLKGVSLEANEMTVESAKALAEKFQTAMDTVHQEEAPLFSRRKSVAADALLKQKAEGGDSNEKEAGEADAAQKNRDLTDTPVAGSPIDAAIRKLLDGNYVCANGVNLDNYLGKGVKIVRSDGRVDTLILVEEAGDGRVRCRKPNSSLFIVKKAKYCFCLPNLLNTTPAQKNQMVEEVEKQRRKPTAEIMKEYSAQWSSAQTVHEEPPTEIAETIQEEKAPVSEPAPQQAEQTEPKKTRFKDQPPLQPKKLEAIKQKVETPTEESYVSTYPKEEPTRSSTASVPAESQEWNASYYGRQSYATPTQEYSSRSPDYSRQRGSIAGPAHMHRAAAYMMRRMSPAYNGYSYNTVDYNAPYGYSSATSAAYSSLPPVAGATYPTNYGASDYSAYQQYMPQHGYGASAVTSASAMGQADSTEQKEYSVVGYIEKWQICVDDRGRQFFIDTEAGTSHWSLPFKLSEMEEKKHAAAAAVATAPTPSPPVDISIEQTAPKSVESEQHEYEEIEEEQQKFKGKAARPAPFKSFFRRAAAS